MKKINGIIMQYFEWYMDCKQNLWNKISEKAKELADIGITALWLPPAYKGFGGKDEVGYAVYDVYDLGEFDQKGTIKTKYGSKDEYLNCIMTLKQNGKLCRHCIKPQNRSRYVANNPSNESRLGKSQ